MKSLLYVVIFILLSACSTAVRTSSPAVMGIVQVEKPPFTIIELSLTPWVAGREEGGTGYLLELTLADPFTTLDSVIYKGNSAVWKQNSMKVDKAIFPVTFIPNGDSPRIFKNHTKKKMVSK